MTLLLLGLALFIGVHSVRIVADDWRARVIAARGPGAWKAGYSLLAVAGFVLICVGFGQARASGANPVLWVPPTGLRHAAALLTLLAFILLAAAKVPGNGIRARVGHPQVLGVKLWAGAHLLANGGLAQVLLFGSLLAWAVLDFRASRQRDRAEGVVRAPGRAGATVLTVGAGTAAWATFAFWAHGVLIGVRPLG